MSERNGPDEPLVYVRQLAVSHPVLVAEAIRDAIVKGRLGAGDRIKEIPLAKQLGLSRGPVRDALRMLEADGLVEIRPNRGACIPDVHALDVLEVYALRASLGSLALHKLMISPDPEAIADLEPLLGRFERAVERRREGQAADADLAFQEGIVRGAGLPRVAREFERLTWQVKMFIAALDMSYEDKLHTMLDEVRDLYAAIADGDAAAAEGLWRDKFERWVRDFVERLPGEEFDAEMWLTLTAGPRATA